MKTSWKHITKPRHSGNWERSSGEPCKHSEYRLIIIMIAPEKRLLLTDLLWVSSIDLARKTKQTEVLLYHIEFFETEFGGALDSLLSSNSGSNLGSNWRFLNYQQNAVVIIMIINFKLNNKQLQRFLCVFCHEFAWLWVWWRRQLQLTTMLGFLPKYHLLWKVRGTKSRVYSTLHLVNIIQMDTFYKKCSSLPWLVDFYIVHC